MNSKRVGGVLGLCTVIAIACGIGGANSGLLGRVESLERARGEDAKKLADTLKKLADTLKERTDELGKLAEESKLLREATASTLSACLGMFAKNYSDDPEVEKHLRGAAAHLESLGKEWPKILQKR